MIKVLMLALLLAAVVQAEEAPAPFTTDGCSGFVDGTLVQQQLWRECCVAHDKAYWLGGTYQERLQADLELQQCVDQVNEPEIAALMLAGVRVGGSPFWPTRFRWGYGWPYLQGGWPRGYQPVSKTMREELEAALTVRNGPN